MKYFNEFKQFSATCTLYKNMNAIVRSSTGDTNFFDVVDGDLQEDTWASYMFILFQDYVLPTSVNLIKENGFTLKKGKKQTISRGNHCKRQLLSWCNANTPAQAKYQLHNLK